MRKYCVTLHVHTAVQSDVREMGIWIMWLQHADVRYVHRAIWV